MKIAHLKPMIRLAQLLKSPTRSSRESVELETALVLCLLPSTTSAHGASGIQWIASGEQD
eukprot:6194752-Pleurochrysis_carterae.AAC.1